MLELLAGPNAMHVGNDPGSPVATVTDLATGQSAFYDDSLGICSFSATVGGYCIVQLDGIAHMRSDYTVHAMMLDMQRPGEWITHFGSFDDSLYLFDKRSGARGELVISTGVTADMTGLAVRAADRFLDVISSAVKWRPLDLSAAVVTEATLTGAGSGRPTISRTRNPNVLALCYSDGPILYYDVLAREQASGSANIGTNDAAWYSTKHDIFVAIASHAVKVYANAVRPSSLSNPAAISPLTQGRVSQVRVQLLGSNSEPCVGELIDWSITAGLGSLVQAQSTTDEDGYAYNDYVAPVSGGAGSPFGNVTIQAQVLF